VPFQIIRNDITKVKADAIVNTANPLPLIGTGTDSAIYAAAGKEQLLAQRKRVGKILPGQAVSTKAFALDARYIIHTVGPSWIDGKHGEKKILASCYRNSLQLAKQLSCTSIAFPLIATGVYQFPKDLALQIALHEISSFLLSHDMQVILVVFDSASFALSKKLSDGIGEYIDDHGVTALKDAEYSHDGTMSVRSRWHPDVNEESSAARDKEPEMLLQETYDLSGKSLDEVVAHTDKTFQERLFELIDANGMDDVTVYKKANIDRKLFSHIRSRKDYQPKKKTAVAFAIALHLDLETLNDLLMRAGIALSPSNPFDLIIMYFVSNKDYDIYKINAALFKYHQPLLGE
jgi:O-acetyl-ADP-ribose deacetylase (regulator of RNase III)